MRFNDPRQIRGSRSAVKAFNRTAFAFFLCARPDFLYSLIRRIANLYAELHGVLLPLAGAHFASGIKFARFDCLGANPPGQAARLNICSEARMEGGASSMDCAATMCEEMCEEESDVSG